MLETLAFSVLAVCVLVSGYFSVTSKHLVRSVLWLAMLLISMAALYLMLQSPFLAAIQIILYTGGVITLMLFGVMMTDQKHDVNRGNPSQRRWQGAVLAGVVFLILGSAILGTQLPAASSQTLWMETPALGAAFLGQHILAFEALSMLLLAAMIGAIVLARRNDPQ